MNINITSTNNVSQTIGVTRNALRVNTESAWTQVRTTGYSWDTSDIKEIDYGTMIG